jgi:hypothetical protein
MITMTKIQSPALYDLAQEGALFRMHFVLWPKYWTAYRYARKLAWTTIRFSASNQSRIPKTAGVYAFHARPGVAPDLNGSYIMYIGQASSLHRRFGEYLREARGMHARPRLYTMFQNYPDHLHFVYASVPLNELTDAEDALLEALWPPMNAKLPAVISGVSNILRGL